MITFPNPIDEGQSAVITFSLVNEAGAPVPDSLLSTFTLTLYDRATNAVINSRTAQNVLNANDVTVDGNGLVTFKMRPLDNPILDATARKEEHVALFIATWTSGGLPQALPIECVLTLRNLTKVP